MLSLAQSSYSLDPYSLTAVARGLSVVLPVFSVFLGLLFGLRYHSFYENFDEILQDAGVEGFTEKQKHHLKFVRSMVFSGIAVFIATLALWLLFGIPPEAGRVWTFYAVCGGLCVLCGCLTLAASMDIRNGVARPWLRYLVLTLGAVGVISTLTAIFTLEANFWV